MNKTLVFDMDGTIADLYGVDGWLDDLLNNNPRPYIEAKPMYDMEDLNVPVDILKNFGWRIVITTWLAKDSNPAYDAMVREAKINWLDRVGFHYDEIHLVKYGTTKANCTRQHGGFQILIDDNDKIRKGWTLGNTIDAKKDILNSLWKLVGAELG